MVESTSKAHDFFFGLLAWYNVRHCITSSVPLPYVPILPYVLFFNFSVFTLICFLPFPPAVIFLGLPFFLKQESEEMTFQICRPMDHNPAGKDPHSLTPSTHAPDNHSNDLHSDWHASHCKGVIGSLPLYCNVMLNEDMWGPHSEPPASCQLCVMLQTDRTWHQSTPLTF